MRFLLAFLTFLTIPATGQNFRVEAIRAHMTFLASDLLEGRGTATRGHRIAAEYVAAQYELAGLEPGANGSWYQDVPFVETVPDAASTVTLTRGGGQPVTLRIFNEFTSYGDPLHGERDVEAEIVFAGYGVTAPDQKYDDYAGIDASGKIVALFSGAPSSFPNAVRAYHSSTPRKFENAARHGAVAIVYLTSPIDAGRVPWERTVGSAKHGSMSWTRPDGTPHGIQRTVSRSVTFNLETTRQLLGNDANTIFESLDRTPKGRALPVRARIHLVSTHSTRTSPNVVGLLRGSDPQLRDEYLVYSSHLDHIGIGDPVDGDAINNGAFDNASGIAAMIEIARALVAAKPRRSILFLATTAEEKGMKGADYFANNPTVPLDSIAGNINIDMLVMTHATRDLLPFGAETNDLGDVARDVARQMKVKLASDPFPEEMIFVRSDQIAFIRRGIPAIYIGPGFDVVASGVDGPGEYRDWLRTRYHSPKDDLQQPIDWSAALLLTEFDYRLGLAAANRDARPRWKPGDFFGETFGRGGSAR
ncbi:MAG TPA: M28 family metallopeptidase [Thermoanaerobaculia bacterium]|nr:M28 family metallopeptidase [Thermoanaerobaculia bacterium]